MQTDGQMHSGQSVACRLAPVGWLSRCTLPVDPMWFHSSACCSSTAGRQSMRPATRKALEAAGAEAAEADQLRREAEEWLTWQQQRAASWQRPVEKERLAQR